MTHDDKQPTNLEAEETQGQEPEPVTGTPVEDAEAPAAESTSSGDNQPEDPETTVGTGTSIALGCVAGTVILIFFGLIFLAIVAIF